jgi:putative transposase
MKFKRCRRINEPGHAHELTFSCFHRLRLLSRDRTRRWLIDAIEQARRRAHFDLWAYVIMPEHVHILVSPRESDYDVSRILWRIKRPVALHAIGYLERNAPEWLPRLTVRRRDGKVERRFWQAGGGYDRNITEIRTVYHVLEFIQQNPVRRGLCFRAEDWEWSSARWYAGIRPVPLEIDQTLPRAYEL